MNKMFRNFFGMFHQSQPIRKTLRDVSFEELRRERIRIEQTETRLMREIEELEQQKSNYFNKGVVEPVSIRQQRQIARKVNELESIIQGQDKQLLLINRNLRVLTGLVELKGQLDSSEDPGMEGLINQMDLEELQTYVEHATIEGQFQIEKLTKILNSMDDANNGYSVTGEDAGTQKILEDMQKARQARTESSFKDGIREVDDLLPRQPVAVAVPN